MSAKGTRKGMTDEEVEAATAPLTEQEAAWVRVWANDLVERPYYAPTFDGKTPDYVALVLRADGLTSVRDRDVLKACGRL